MQTSLVATIIGPDRPGLVQTISKTVTENGGNWLQSRMAHLAGQFAGILQIEVSEEKCDELKPPYKERLESRETPKDRGDPGWRRVRPPLVPLSAEAAPALAQGLAESGFTFGKA